MNDSYRTVIKSNKLTPEEHMFLAYILVKNVERKFIAPWCIPALRSLVVRGNLRDLGGPVNNYLYEFTDHSWSIIQNNQSFFLPQTIIDNPQAIAEVIECVENMIKDASKDREILDIQYAPFEQTDSEKVVFTKEDSHKILLLNRKYEEIHKIRKKYNLWPHAQVD